MLEVKDVSKTFSDIKALNKVSFTAQEGQILGIIGKNGAGKSTLFRIILNILEADEGKVLLEGKKYLVKDSAKIGYLPEEVSFSGEYTVYDQIVFYASLKGMTEELAREKLMYWLERFGIIEYINKKIKELSKGNRQRIQFISSIIHNPKLVILDEPFSGLDPFGVEKFKEILLEQKKEGKIIIFSSHRLEHIEKFSDNILILDKGNILAFGNLQEVKKEYLIKHNLDGISLEELFMQIYGGENAK